MHVIVDGLSRSDLAAEYVSAVTDYVHAVRRTLKCRRADAFPFRVQGMGWLEEAFYGYCCCAGYFHHLYYQLPWNLRILEILKLCNIASAFVDLVVVSSLVCVRKRVGEKLQRCESAARGTGSVILYF